MLEWLDAGFARAGSDAAPGAPVWEYYDVRVCYGVLITTRANSAAYWPDLQRVLPPQSIALLGEGTGITYSVVWAEDRCQAEHELYRGHECILRTADRGSLLAVLQSDAEWQVATRALDYTFVHAGAVVAAEGALVLPGVSGAGKSTLVMKLLARGCQYYSDEYAVLDRSGRLHAFPCALKLKDQFSGMRSVDPQSLGASVGHKPWPVRLLAFPTFAPGCDLHIEELPASQGALNVLQHIPTARLHPGAALAASAATARTATCLRILHEDSEAVADALLTWIT